MNRNTTTKSTTAKQTRRLTMLRASLLRLKRNPSRMMMMTGMTSQKKDKIRGPESETMQRRITGRRNKLKSVPKNLKSRSS